MRNITEIIIHCSATPEGQDYTVRDITRWHKERGFNTIGYHYVVYRDGTVAKGRPDDTPGAHCTGHNAASIGICYIGGLDKATRQPKDTRTAAQRVALRELVRSLLNQHPGATIHGHNEFAAKACPCFPVSQL